jgi:hypothetical protein
LKDKQETKGQRGGFSQYCVNQEKPKARTVPNVKQAFKTIRPLALFSEADKETRFTRANSVKATFKPCGDWLFSSAGGAQRLLDLIFDLACPSSLSR